MSNSLLIVSTTTMRTVTHLHEFLVCKMMAWIQLKYQHVVDTRRPPPVRVDTEQEDKQDDEKYAAIHAQCSQPVHRVMTHGYYRYKTTHKTHFTTEVCIKQKKIMQT